MHSELIFLGFKHIIDNGTNVYKIKSFKVITKDFYTYNVLFGRERYDVYSITGKIIIKAYVKVWKKQLKTK